MGMSEERDTGGWALTDGYASDDRLCLMADEGSIDIVYNSNPLSAPQMRALASVLVEKAEGLEAKRS
jgi:hypothetical protein